MTRLSKTQRYLTECKCMFYCIYCLENINQIILLETTSKCKFCWMNKKKVLKTTVLENSISINERRLFVFDSSEKFYKNQVCRHAINK